MTPSVPCPRCAAELPAPLPETAVTCPSCGSTHAVRRVIASSLDARKTAGVSRRRYRLAAREGGDPIVFEGPPGIDIASDDEVTLLYREGQPRLAAWRDRIAALEVAASQEMEEPPRSGGRPVAAALLWLLATILLLAAAYLLDRGTQPLWP